MLIESFSEMVFVKWIFVLSGESFMNLPVSFLQLAKRITIIKRLFIPFIQHMKIYCGRFYNINKKGGPCGLPFLLMIDFLQYLLLERSVT
jgi:hypothetical protein